VVASVFGVGLAGCGDGSVAPAYLVAASAPGQPGMVNDGRVDMLEPAARYVQSVPGAEATARHFLAAWTYAAGSGNIRPIEAVTFNTCTYCQGLIKQIAARAAASQRMTGAQLVPTYVVSTMEQPDIVVVTVRADRKEALVVDLTGKAVSTHPAATDVSLAVRMSWAGDRWWVERVDAPGGLL
jgi:hypothetical protein